MTAAVLYRWKLKPGRAAEFEAAWTEGTRRIHQACGSYGAILHCGEDGLYWSYAAWPSEAVRKACFAAHDWFTQDCFQTMQACIAERFDEIPLSVARDQMQARTPGCDVPVLTTDRLLLRPLRQDDATALLPALQDADTMKYWSRAPVDGLAEAREYLAGSTRSSTVRCWAITRPPTPDDALGWVVLIDRKSGVAETGYIIRPDTRRHGYVNEAVRRVLDHGFSALGLRRIYADTDPDNAGSIAVLSKLGFVEEGRLRAQWETHIGVRDSLIFGLLRSDWCAPHNDQVDGRAGTVSTD
ncbi:GNAT family protein [Maricaulis sp.]|uniref:GNAT family protein n=1 Tax=Maricaulis sp. TaxID=1486257 RepID=UPI0025BAFE6C|nr:GNAT family protein [Maricaulis sp.]